jgi:ATP-dependent RNA helicase RhlE
MNFNSFSFDTRIRRAIADAEYISATPIQERAIPHVLEGRDVLGVAQTGTGKTAAFLLPILQRLVAGPRRVVRALVIAPTRELAEQIAQVAVDLGRYVGIRCTSVYGGVNRSRQVAALARGSEIVVACPGRLLDLLGDRSIDLSRIEVLVLDEADRMCDMGFLPDIRRILTKLPKNRQTLFFSATMADDIRKLSSEILDKPEAIQIGRIEPVRTVTHALFPVPADLRKAFFFALLDRTASERVLVFTRTKHRAKSLALALGKRGYRVASLQGNLSQNRRQDAIDGFRGGKYDVLVATDIASRGIDVEDVTHVINYDMPDTVDAYTHRIGRTGRAHKSGDAFTIAVAEDADLVRRIERTLGSRIERKSLPGFNYGEFVPEAQFSKSATDRRSGQDAFRRPRPSRKKGASHRRPGSRGPSRR